MMSLSVVVAVVVFVVVIVAVDVDVVADVDVIIVVIVVVVVVVNLLLDISKLCRRYHPQIFHNGIFVSWTAIFVAPPPPTPPRLAPLHPELLCSSNQVRLHFCCCVVSLPVFFFFFSCLSELDAVATLKSPSHPFSHA